jgi:Fe-S-cluster containining protein
LRGLPLCDNEAPLFPKGSVSPKLALGVKAPEFTVIYQLNRNCCPHINEHNSCTIYFERPLMCRSFPIVGGAISNKCTVFSYRKPGLSYDEPFSMKEQMAASNKFEDYIKKKIKKCGLKNFKIWEYDLASNNWLPLI